MANQQNTGRFPYGNAFIVGTPYIDNLQKQIVADQRLEDLQGQKYAEGLDEMFAKNIANVRDEDVADISNDWAKYKALSIDLYKNGNRLSNEERIAKEMEKQRALGSVMSSINESKQNRVLLEGYGKQFADPKKLDNFYDDANTMLANTFGKTTKQLKQQGLLRNDPDNPANKIAYNPFDYNSYLYRGNATKYQPIIAKSVGTQHKRPTTYEPLYDKDGKTVLGKTEISSEAINSPAEQFSLLGQQMKGAGEISNFNRQFKNNFDDETEARIVKAYTDKAQNDPAWKQAWGNEGVRLPIDAISNPQTRIMALTVIQNALLHDPVITRREQQNAGAMMDKRFGQANSLLDKRIKSSFEKTQYVQGKKDVRAAAYTIPSLVGDLKEKPVIELPYPIGDNFKNTIKVIDVTNLSEQDRDDLYGKPEGQFNLRHNPPIELNGKEYVKINENGNLVGEKGIPYDEYGTFANTYKRLHQVKEAQAKQKLVVPNSGTTLKQLSLAERMKAAKNKK